MTSDESQKDFGVGVVILLKLLSLWDPRSLLALPKCQPSQGSRNNEKSCKVMANSRNMMDNHENLTMRMLMQVMMMRTKMMIIIMMMINVVKTMGHDPNHEK